MPVGDSHLAFAEAAAGDGIVLDTRAMFDWLTELGHITLEQIAEDPPAAANVEAVNAAIDALDEIWSELRGDIDVLLCCRNNLFLPVDLLHEPTGTLIELDEAQHFTSFRLAALDAYPPDAKVGFDLEEYRQLCRDADGKMDGFQRAQAAKGFGIGGMPRERAYRDSLRDLATPAMGHPPVVRIPVLDEDGAAAYERHKESLMDLLGAAR